MLSDRTEKVNFSENQNVTSHWGGAHQCHKGKKCVTHYLNGPLEFLIICGNDILVARLFLIKWPVHERASMDREREREIKVDYAKMIWLLKLFFAWAFKIPFWKLAEISFDVSQITYWMNLSTNDLNKSKRSSFFGGLLKVFFSNILDFQQTLAIKTFSSPPYFLLRRPRVSFTHPLRKMQMLDPSVPPTELCPTLLLHTARIYTQNFCFTNSILPSA